MILYCELIWTSFYAENPNFELFYKLRQILDFQVVL